MVCLCLQQYQYNLGAYPKFSLGHLSAIYVSIEVLPTCILYLSSVHEMVLDQLVSHATVSHLHKSAATCNNLEL